MRITAEIGVIANPLPVRWSSPASKATWVASFVERRGQADVRGVFFASSVPKCIVHLCRKGIIRRGLEKLRAESDYSRQSR